MTALTALSGDPTYAQSEQAYPQRPIRLVAPFAAGGGSDVSARIFGQKLSESLGQQVIVDNRPGAGGIVGAEIVAKALPDGYTLMLASIAHTALPSLHKKLPYDIVSDFAPISMLVSFSHLLVVHPSVPAKSVKELIALAKAKPGFLNYASGGIGSSAHLNAELLKSMAGINVVHVPYKGAGPALVGSVAGEASMGFWSVSASVQLVKTGKLRALASSGKTRAPSFPDLPTVAEAGVPGFEASTWTGIMAPARTSKPVVTRLHNEFVRMLSAPDVRERLAAIDFEPVGSTPEEFSLTLKQEVAKWSKVVNVSGAKVE